MDALPSERRPFTSVQLRLPKSPYVLRGTEVNGGIPWQLRLSEGSPASYRKKKDALPARGEAFRRKRASFRKPPEVKLPEGRSLPSESRQR